MRISDLINKLLYKNDFTFYINDKITDLDKLIRCDYEVDNFEIDGNAFYFNSLDYQE
jgi:hypothetical protein